MITLHLNNFTQKIGIKLLSIKSALLIAFLFQIIWITYPMGTIHGECEVFSIRLGRDLANGISYLEGVFYNPPLFFYWIAALIKIFGAEIIVLRFFMILCTLATIYLLYLIVSEFGEEKYAIYAAYLYALFPVTVLYSKWVYIDTFMIMLGILAFYFLILGLKRDKLIFYLLSGIFFGFAVFSKLPAVLIILPMLYIYIKLEKNKKHLLKIGTFLFGACFIQILWYLYAFFTEPEFLKTGKGQFNRNLISALINNMLPNYVAVIAVIAFLYFVFILIYLFKNKPDSPIRKSMAFFYGSYAIFLLILPLHDYYFLPCFAPLAIDFALSVDEKKLKKIISAFVIISIISLAIFPVAEIDYREVGEYIKSKYDISDENLTLLCNNGPQLSYYTGRNVTTLKIENLRSNNTIIVISIYSKILNRKIFDYVEKNYVLVKKFHYKVWMYTSQDLVLT